MSLSKMDYKFFSKARKAAEFSDIHRTHLGCVAVYQGSVIGIGYNMNKTHPIQKYYNRYRKLYYHLDTYIPNLHAEISCLNSIRHLDVNFSKVKLYIYRIRLDQDYGLARPCPSCMAAIKDLGIKDVYYTTNDGFAYEKVENKYVGMTA